MNQIPFLTSSRKFDRATLTNVEIPTRPLGIYDGNWHEHDGLGNPFKEGNYFVKVEVVLEGGHQSEIRFAYKWSWINKNLPTPYQIDKFRVVHD